MRSDNGLIFTARRFRAACHDYRLSQEFITPCTPEENGMIQALLPFTRGGVHLAAQVRRFHRGTSGDRELDPPVQRASSPSGARLPSAHISTGLSNCRWWLEMGGALERSSITYRAVRFRPATSRADKEGVGLTQATTVLPLITHLGTWTRPKRGGPGTLRAGPCVGGGVCACWLSCLAGLKLSFSANQWSHSFLWWLAHHSHR